MPILCARLTKGEIIEARREPSLTVLERTDESALSVSVKDCRRPFRIKWPPAIRYIGLEEFGLK